MSLVGKMVIKGGVVVITFFSNMRRFAVKRLFRLFWPKFLEKNRLLKGIDQLHLHIMTYVTYLWKGLTPANTLKQFFVPLSVNMSAKNGWKWPKSGLKCHFWALNLFFIHWSYKNSQVTYLWKGLRPTNTLKQFPSRYLCIWMQKMAKSDRKVA